MTTVSVLTGPERRRRWSSTEKARIVEESLQPGAGVSAVARRHDVHPNLLHHWRRQAKRENGGALRFVPIAVAPAARAGLRADGSIEIELGSVRVHVDSAVDEAALERVLRVLGR